MARNMLGYFSADVPRSEQFRSRKTMSFEDVQGQISEHVFCVLSFKYFSQHAQFWKLENITHIFPSFSRGIFSPVTRLDQSHASENIWWVISFHIFWLMLPWCCLGFWKALFHFSATLFGEVIKTNQVTEMNGTDCGVIQGDILRKTICYLQWRLSLSKLFHCCLHSFSFSFFFLSELRLRCGCISGTTLGFDSGSVRVAVGLSSGLLFCGFLPKVGSINSAMLQSVPFRKWPLLSNSWLDGSELATVDRRSKPLCWRALFGISSPSS